MTRSVIIFEDHTFENFRPLALSVPSYEIRVGMFNLRERVELILQEMGTANNGKILLCRDVLAPLHTCEGWQINPDTFELGSERVLWINGRCIPEFEDLADLLKNASNEVGFVCADDFGLVAADLSLKESSAVIKSWHEWSQNFQKSGSPVLPWNVVDHLKALKLPERTVPSLGHIWDLVPATPELLKNDIRFVGSDQSFSRRPFAIFPAVENTSPYWLKETTLVPASLSSEYAQRFSATGEDIWLGEGVSIAESVAFDTSKGPIILDNQVKVMPFCFLEGPLYLGPGCIVKAGAAIYGESSFGIGNRLAGEIGESTFADFANKQHDGFIGHAVLGSWTNLGAMTTCSDLKNNYGNVRMDLGAGTVDTGLRFVGLMMGDHVKTAIGTLFNTGTCVGFASNIFGGEMPPKFVGSYSWGGMPENPLYDVERAIDTAAIVLSRRGCRLTEAGKNLMRLLS